jgi:transcriptional regulator with PAS, ATPase and Fis domain/tRNA A-37 threonylcarbamoyl transferase component Bud32
MHVFISYSHPDKDFASRLCNDLTLYDIEVWFDEWSIRPGDSVPQAIADGLQSAGHVLLLVSTAAISSNWVREELNTTLHAAFSTGRPGIIALRLDRVPLPMMLQHRKALDFVDPEQYEENLALLVGALFAHVEQPSAPQPVIPGFRDVRLLGEGGFSTVYKALDARTHAIKAIKIPKGRRRFDREIIVGQRLNHSGIVPIEATVAYKERTLLVMPYAGHSLKWYMDQKVVKPQQIDQIVAWMATLADILSFAHGHRIVHRDIKPSNILIDEFGQLRVVDFGIAQGIQYAELQLSTIVRGTLCYMSPEQQLAQPATKQSDIYSLGAVLYELVTGEKPVGRFKSPRSFNSQIPVALERVIERCLERRPEDRFDSAAQVGSQLRASLRQTRVQKGEETPEQKGSDFFFLEVPGIRGELEQAERIAASSTTVLIIGETGTGKESMARFIYDRAVANRAIRGPFVSVEIGGLPETLMESHLFGHEKGSFTGAARQTPGAFERANGGVLHLAGVDELSMRIQAMLLRVLSENTFERIGATKPVRVSVRVIASAGHRLRELVEAGQFREDLYYRLNVVTITLPPLRARPADIPLLADYFLREQASRLNLLAPQMPDDVRRQLMLYRWPGNIRELRNWAERVLVMGGRDEGYDFLRPLMHSTLQQQVKTLKAARDDAEKHAILTALQAQSDHAAAAALLGISVPHLRKMIKHHKIEKI